MHNKFVLQSDGAGAYAGIGLLSRLGYLGNTIGMRVLNHYTGESGGGKSSVDQIFGICKEELKRRVTKGMGEYDISDARSLAKTLNYKAIKKTVNYAITFSRSGVLDPKLNKSAREGRLQAHSTRTYQYDDNGLPLLVELQEQSYLPIIGEPKNISMVGMWPNIQSPYSEIIPNAIKLTSSTDPELSSVDAIRQATTIYVKKSDKDNGAKERKIIQEEKKKHAKIDDMNRVQYRMQQAENYAKNCGLTCYTLCPFPGCIRQFTSEARVEQHMRCGAHQSNGNPLSQSNKMREPSVLDGQTVKEMAINSLLTTVVSTNSPVDAVQNTVIPEAVGMNSDLTDFFGWATRFSLKHPKFLPEVSRCLNWLFDQGNTKGGSKCSASTMIAFTREYGTAVQIFEKNTFWTEAITRSEGRSIFTEAQIPEEWQVKQFIGQSTTAVKQKQKLKAGLHALSVTEKRSQLIHYLTLIPLLPSTPDAVADLLLSLQIELSSMRQKDISENIKSLGTLSPAMKRQITNACKEVGKLATTSSDTIIMRDNVQEEHVNEEENNQDTFDTEHNNDDIDTQ